MKEEPKVVILYINGGISCATNKTPDTWVLTMTWSLNSHKIKATTEGILKEQLPTSSNPITVRTYTLTGEFHVPLK